MATTEVKTMNKRGQIILLFGAVVLIVGIVIFIYFSNDHMQCENFIEHSIGAKGETISTERHLCRERLSL